MEKVTYALTLSYEGSVFKGWHTQRDVATVQGTLNQVLSDLYGYNIFTWGAGRTDSGAHAICYTAHFRTRNDVLPLDKMAQILNGKLPQEIRIYDVEKKPNEFHATFSCEARSYCYFVYLGDILPPRFYKKVHHERDEIDFDRLHEILHVFVGTKNFESFCYGYSATERERKTMVRRLDSFRVKKIGNFLVFFIKGEGFLRGMIRTLIGVSLSYAKGILLEQDVYLSIESQKPLPNGQWKPVPAEGLYFKRAHYPQDK